MASQEFQSYCCRLQQAKPKSMHQLCSTREDPNVCMYQYPITAVCVRVCMSKGCLDGSTSNQSATTLFSETLISVETLNLTHCLMTYLSSIITFHWAWSLPWMAGVMLSILPTEYWSVIQMYGYHHLPSMHKVWKESIISKSLSLFPSQMSAWHKHDKHTDLIQDSWLCEMANRDCPC